MHAPAVVSVTPTASLSVVNSTVNGNNATETGSTQIGGGKFLSQVSATTHILRSTVSGNQATGNGGGIANVGGSSLVVTDSTISGNSSTDGNGGGISHADTGTTASLVNVTVTDNHAGGGSGAGIQNDGDAESVSFLNTIIAGQTSAEPDCGPGSNSAADAFNSQGYNLDSDGSCGLEVSASDLPSANADLDPLGDYGGPTQTHQLQSTSDAIDAGDSDTCSASYDSSTGAGSGPYDQRDIGFSRISGATCDIGAFEVQTTAPPATVTATKTDAVVVDNDNGSDADPGDTIEYTVTLELHYRRFRCRIHRHAGR